MSVGSVSDILPSLKEPSAYSPLAKYECSYYSHPATVSPTRNYTDFQEVLVSTSFLGSEILKDSQSPFYCYDLKRLKYCQYESDVVIPILPFASYESVGYFKPSEDFSFREYITNLGYDYGNLQIENPSLFKNLNDKFNELNDKGTFLTLEVPEKTTICIKYTKLQTKEELEIMEFKRNAFERWNNEINVLLGIITVILLFSMKCFEKSTDNGDVSKTLTTYGITLVILYTLTDIIPINNHICFDEILTGYLLTMFLCGFFGLLVFYGPLENDFVKEVIILMKEPTYYPLRHKVNLISGYIIVIFLLRSISDCVRFFEVLGYYEDIYLYSTPRLLYLIEPFVYQSFNSGNAWYWWYWFVKIFFFLISCLLLYYMVSLFRELRSLAINNLVTNVILIWISGVFSFEIGLTIIYHGYVDNLSHSIINKIYMFWSQIVFLFSCLAYISIKCFKGFFNSDYKPTTELEMSELAEVPNK